MKKALDPAGHLTIAVSDLTKSKKFYTQLFGLLKFKRIRDSDRSIAWVTREGFGVWIKQAKLLKPRYKYFAPGLQHLCVMAKSKKEVDDVYRRMAAKKVFVFDEPKRYPEYTPKYYAVFLADPDGIKIEIAYY